MSIDVGKRQGCCEDCGEYAENTKLFRFTGRRYTDNTLFPCGSTKGGNETFDRTTGREGQLTLQRHREAGTVDKRCRICNGDELYAMFAGGRRSFFVMHGKGRSISLANYNEQIPWLRSEHLLSV